MKKSIVWGSFLLLLASSVTASETKVVCKTSRLGPMAVAIVCTNGADATGTKMGNVLIISCADLRTGK